MHACHLRNLSCFPLYTVIPIHTFCPPAKHINPLPHSSLYHVLIQWYLFFLYITTHLLDILRPGLYRSVSVIHVHPCMHAHVNAYIPEQLSDCILATFRVYNYLISLPRHISLWSWDILSNTVRHFLHASKKQIHSKGATQYSRRVCRRSHLKDHRVDHSWDVIAYRCCGGPLSLCTVSRSKLMRTSVQRSQWYARTVPRPMHHACMHGDIKYCAAMCTGKISLHHKHVNLQYSVLSVVVCIL